MVFIVTIKPAHKVHSFLRRFVIIFAIMGHLFSLSFIPLSAVTKKSFLAYSLNDVHLFSTKQIIVIN